MISRQGRFAKLERNRLYGMSIDNSEKDDVIAMIGYLFKITNDMNNATIYEQEDAFPVLVNFATKLQALDRLSYVLSTYVRLFAESQILHRITGEESDLKFAEDEEVIGHRTIADFNKLELNYSRLMITRGYGVFSQILYYTFFSNAKNLMEFHEKFPVRFEKKLHDTSKVDFIKKELNLTQAEAEYLLFRFRKAIIVQVADILDFITTNSFELYGKALDMKKEDFLKITRNDSKLRQFGLINVDRDLNPVLLDCIEAQDFSIFFADCIKNQPLSNTYKLDTFSVPQKNTEIYKSLLKSENPVSILLYGDPGAGKTEYAKSLIQSTGKKALIFKNEAEVMNKQDAICCLNCFLSLDQKDTVLIVDEAESVLRTGVPFPFIFNQPQNNKGMVNKMLENSKCKVIWIVNYKSNMDTSTLRRFTVSCKFEPMSASMLESIAAKKLDGLEIENDTKKEILKLLSKYKVTGASVDNLVKTINSMGKNRDEELLENVGIVLQDNSALLNGEVKLRTKVKDSYDMSVLNTSMPAEKIMKMLLNAKKYADENSGNGAVRMLFYGLSGTGKTEFARYISEVLGKEILLKRASDILDKHVGETEQKIAAAFEEARNNDQILLFDEADSFFADRNMASQSWERTQVNEFLTQLEEFPGFVICTTNLRNIMDPAMLRRFHITVDFKALTEEGIEKLLGRFFKNYSFEKKMISKLADFGTVTPGDFSKLSDTIKFMDQEEVDSEYIFDQLCEIQKEKNQQECEHKIIGFCA